MAGSVIIVTGSTGAGKTTHARQLERDHGALRFSIDEWMTTLFWMDSPQPIIFDWTMERINRCEAMIRSVAAQQLAHGGVVVLDLGFTTKDHRTNWVQWAQDQGATARIDFVDVSANDRWQRVQHRNADQGETYAMQVDRAMFDFMESRWEAPDAQELAIAVQPTQLS